MNVQEAVRLLVAFGTYNSLNELYMIDMGYLYSRGLTEESECIKLLAAQALEASEARRSLIAFELDSLSDVTKAYSSLQSDLIDSSRFATETSGASLSYNLGRPQLFSAAVAQFRNVDANRQRWTVAIAEYLMSDLIVILFSRIDLFFFVFLFVFSLLPSTFFFFFYCSWSKTSGFVSSIQRDVGHADSNRSGNETGTRTQESQAAMSLLSRGSLTKPTS